MNHVGQEVKRRREELGWPQARLAAAAGTSVSAVSLIENGKRVPHSGTLAKLADALGCEPADLYPKAQAPLPLDDAGGAAERGFDTAEDLVQLIESAVEPERRPSWNELTDDQLVRVLARYRAVRRRLAEADSEKLRRHGGALIDRLINATAAELERRRKAGYELSGEFGYIESVGIPGHALFYVREVRSALEEAGISEDETEAALEVLARR